EGLHGDLETLCVEGLRQESPFTREEQMTSSRGRRGGSVDHVGVDPGQELSLFRVERSDIERMRSSLYSGLETLREIDEMSPVRQEEGIAVTEFVLGSIQLRHWRRRASGRGDPIEGIARRRAEDDHSLPVPCPAAALRRVAEGLGRTARGIDLL